MRNFGHVSVIDQQRAVLAKAIVARPTKPVVNGGPKIGRNAPCPCGSGKKYKKCCGEVA